MTPGAKLGLIAAGFLACNVATGLGVWYMTRPDPAPEPAAIAQPLPEAPKAKGKPKRAVKTKTGTVEVFKDAPAHLPDQKPTEAVTTTGELSAREGEYGIFATIDLDTGKSRVWAERQPDPAFAFNTRGEAGLFIGPRSDGETVARAYIRQNLIQSKTWRLGGLATIDSDGEWFAGAGVAIPLW